MTTVSFDNRTNNYQHSIRGTTAVNRYMFMYKGLDFMLLWELIKQSKAVTFVSDTGAGSPQNRPLRESGCKVGEGRNEEITGTNRSLSVFITSDLDCPAKLQALYHTHLHQRFREAEGLSRERLGSCSPRHSGGANIPTTCMSYKIVAASHLPSTIAQESLVVHSS